MYDTIIYEVDNPVATITLNRPEAMNAWTNRWIVKSVMRWHEQVPTPRSSASSSPVLGERSAQVPT